MPPRRKRLGRIAVDRSADYRLPGNWLRDGRLKRPDGKLGCGQASFKFALWPSFERIFSLQSKRPQVLTKYPLGL